MRRSLLVVWVTTLGAAASSAGLLLPAACAPQERSFGDSAGGAGGNGAGGNGAGDSGGSGGSGGAAPDEGGAGGAAGDGAGSAAAGGAGGEGPTDVPPGPPEIIAQGLDRPHSIAVDDRSAFILGASTLLRCPLAGCPRPVTIADGLSPPGAVTPPYMISVDAQFVHWLSSPSDGGTRRYYRCSAAGCSNLAPEEMWEALGSSLIQIEVGADGVVRTADKSSVYECAGGTCTSISCVDADGLRSFVMDKTTLYWAHTTDPGGVYACERSGMEPALRLHAEAGAAMAIQDDVHYVMSANAGAIFACKKTGCGGSPATFVEGEPSLTSMAVGPTGVYWTAGGDMLADGVVKMCPLVGCGEGPRIIASSQARPTSIRLRNGFVYWVNRGLPGNPMSGELVRAGL